MNIFSRPIILRVLEIPNSMSLTTEWAILLKTLDCGGITNACLMFLWHVMPKVRHILPYFNKIAHSVFIYSQTLVYPGWSNVKSNDKHNVTEFTISLSLARTKIFVFSQAHHACLLPLENSEGSSSVSQNQNLKCLDFQMTTAFLKLRSQTKIGYHPLVFF